MKKNWKQIAFTIFLAVSLWVIVTLSSTFYTSVYLPVRVHLADSTLAVSAISHKFVIVGVQGEGWVLSGYYWGGIFITENRRQSFLKEILYVLRVFGIRKRGIDKLVNLLK